MKLGRSIILTILLVLGFVIVSNSQTASNSVCLTAQEFDFYAEALVRGESLKTDTGLLRSQVKDYANIVNEKEAQLKATESIVIVKDSIINDCKAAYVNLGESYGQEKEKTRFLKQALGSSGGLILILAVLLLL